MPVRFDARAARAALGDWRVLYTRCFSSPPRNEPDRSLAEYAKKIEWHLDRLGFRAFEARAVDGTLAAVAYGWPAAETPPDLPFYHWVADSLGPEGMDRLWAKSPFEVVELMVDPETRGQGLARRLLDDLCPANGVSWPVTHTEASGRPVPPTRLAVDRERHHRYRDSAGLLLP